MAVYRESPKCPRCNGTIYAKRREVSNSFIGDTFIGWDYAGHICENNFNVDAEITKLNTPARYDENAKRYNYSEKDINDIVDLATKELQDDLLFWKKSFEERTHDWSKALEQISILKEEVKLIGRPAKRENPKLLEENAYVISVDTYDKDMFSYALFKKTGDNIFVIRTSRMRDNVKFEEDIKELSIKYNAEVWR